MLASIVPAGAMLFEEMEGPVATSADIDGDGVRELIVANRNVGMDADDRANTVCAFSARRGWACLRRLAGGAGFGSALANAGDLDADGADDLLITTGDRRSTDACILQATSGRTGTVLWELQDKDIGSDLCGPGDVNGDGRADVGFTAARVNGQPGVRVVSGLDGSTLWSRGWDAENASWNESVDFQWQEWMGIAALGDTNGDGVPDLAVSAPTPVAEKPHRTQVRILSGRDGAVLLTLPAALGLLEARKSLSDAGDLDGDGRADLLLADMDASDDGISEHRRVIAISGRDGRVLWSTSALPDHPTFGEAVAGIGDATGDGVADVLVGAPIHGDGVMGAAILLSGADGSVLHVWEGAHETGEHPDCDMPGYGFAFGACVAGIGDVNQDGYADMIVGEDRYWSTGLSYADRVVVLAGGQF